MKIKQKANEIITNVLEKHQNWPANAICEELEKAGFLNFKEHKDSTATYSPKTHQGILESRAANHGLTLNDYVKAVRNGKIKE